MRLQKHEMYNASNQRTAIPHQLLKKQHRKQNFRSESHNLSFLWRPKLPVKRNVNWELITTQTFAAEIIWGENSLCDTGDLRTAGDERHSMYLYGVQGWIEVSSKRKSRWLLAREKENLFCYNRKSLLSSDSNSNDTSGRFFFLLHLLNMEQLTLDISLFNIHSIFII